MRKAWLLLAAALAAPGLAHAAVYQHKAGVTPEAGTVLVTGATGGVGSIAVVLLKQLGYRVAAATGKAEQAEFLRGLGADEIVSREELQQGSERPMLKERWAAAVDTVGGDILFNVVKSLRHSGSVACCGLTAGVSFQASVLPFILRGVNLFPTQIEELILRTPALSPHFQLHLSTPGRMDALAVHVGRRVDALPQDGETAGAELVALIKNTIGVSASVVVQDPDTIERSLGKMRRIVDARRR